VADRSGRSGEGGRGMHRKGSCEPKKRRGRRRRPGFGRPVVRDSLSGPAFQLTGAFASGRGQASGILIIGLRKSTEGNEGGPRRFRRFQGCRAGFFGPGAVSSPNPEVTRLFTNIYPGLVGLDRRAPPTQRGVLRRIFWKAAALGGKNGHPLRGGFEGWGKTGHSSG